MGKTRHKGKARADELKGTIRNDEPKDLVLVHHIALGHEFCFLWFLGMEVIESPIHEVEVMRIEIKWKQIGFIFLKL